MDSQGFTCHMISSANHIGSMLILDCLPHVIVDNVHCCDSESGYQIEETVFVKELIVCSYLLTRVT
jgi:hypothetical protein